MLMEVFGV